MSDTEDTTPAMNPNSRPDAIETNDPANKKKNVGKLVGIGLVLVAAGLQSPAVLCVFAENGYTRAGWVGRLRGDGASGEMCRLGDRRWVRGVLGGRWV